MVNEETQNSPQNEKREKEMRKGEGGGGKGRDPLWKLTCHVL